jgi:hypothetical protein
VSEPTTRYHGGIKDENKLKQMNNGEVKQKAAVKYACVSST